MEFGIINFFDPLKGYGFIRREHGKDVFFKHEDFSDIDNNPDIFKGIRVGFFLRKTEKGLRAMDIERQ